MSLIPAFKIGLWNAWIFWVLQVLSMIIPDFFMSEEAKIRTKRAPQFVAFNKKKEKILALSTHMIIMPFSIIYSIFLPLQLGTTWFYIGLVIFISALVMSFMTTISFATTPVDKPVTSGIYRISRHPIYFSGFLLNLSIAIACASWVIMLCAILWIVFFHNVVSTEESYLINQYGDVYSEYMNRTPRWIGIPKSRKD
ncbi:MAG: isoprenylcysteine carboxylmethyltransferase family protein [Anaerolineales bacterium]|nr:isoprenylcysteine carboxylmethyltransferase family protein [Anaerolineales bacterium]